MIVTACCLFYVSYTYMTFQKLALLLSLGNWLSDFFYNAVAFVFLLYSFNSRRVPEPIPVAAINVKKYEIPLKKILMASCYLRIIIVFIRVM